MNCLLVQKTTTICLKVVKNPNDVTLKLSATSIMKVVHKENHLL